MSIKGKAKNAADLYMKTVNCTVRTTESGQNVLRRAVGSVASAMKFKINNRTWSIKELSQEEIKKEYKRHLDGEPAERGKYFGITYADEQVILLDKDLNAETKKNTLKHELAHCYMSVYCYHAQDKFSEEDMADLVANSNDFVNEVVGRYFVKNEYKSKHK